MHGNNKQPTILFYTEIPEKFDPCLSRFGLYKIRSIFKTTNHVENEGLSEANMRRDELSWIHDIVGIQSIFNLLHCLQILYSQFFLKVLEMKEKATQWDKICIIWLISGKSKRFEDI